MYTFPKQPTVLVLSPCTTLCRSWSRERNGFVPLAWSVSPWSRPGLENQATTAPNSQSWSTSICSFHQQRSWCSLLVHSLCHHPPAMLIHQLLRMNGSHRIWKYICFLLSNNSARTSRCWRRITLIKTSSSSSLNENRTRVACTSNRDPSTKNGAKIGRECSPSPPIPAMVMQPAPSRNDGSGITVSLGPSAAPWSTHIKKKEKVNIQANNHENEQGGCSFLSFEPTLSLVVFQ